MRARSLVFGLFLFGLLLPVAAQGDKYGIRATADRETNFGRLRTYTWVPGWAASDRDVDRQVVTAVDRELAKRGLTKLDSQPSDVVVTYAALQRTGVDLKSTQPDNPAIHREYPVGSLVVLLIDSETRREVFRVRGDTRLVANSGSVPALIDILVARMFEKYPAPVNRR